MYPKAEFGTFVLFVRPTHEAFMDWLLMEEEPSASLIRWQLAHGGCVSM